MIVKDLTSGIPGNDPNLRAVREQLKEILNVMNGNLDGANIGQMVNLGQIVLHSIYFALQNTPMESLRYVRGTVGGTTTPPTIEEGTGWTVARTALGRWTVTFSTAYSSPPSVVVVAQRSSFRAAALVSPPVAGSFTVQVVDLLGNDLDENFCFIAVGPT